MGARLSRSRRSGAHPDVTGWLDRLFVLMQTRGHAHYGEGLSQLDHMLQAAHLAEQRGLSSSMIGAALLHDVGHLVSEEGEADDAPTSDREHERIGARFLAQMFPTSVIGPVAMHVAAKRYLCTVDAAYQIALSAASRHSLQLQGGLMSSEQRCAFERSFWFEEALQLRALDDAAKQTGLASPDLEYFRPLLTALIHRRFDLPH